MVNTMTELGYLLWTRVSNVDIPLDLVARAEGLPLPDPPIPIDVYRRVTGPSMATRYDLGEYGDLELTCVKVEAPSEKMLVRHVVGTLYRDGVTKLTRKVGDAAFYKPPRGKNSKARLRVQVSAPVEEWKEAVDEYACMIRAKYEAGCAGHLDTQGVRRIIRGYLNHIGALYLEGPYFLMRREYADPLRQLFELLGNSGLMFVVPMPDTPEGRIILERSLQHAAEQGEEHPKIIERLKETT